MKRSFLLVGFLLVLVTLQACSPGPGPEDYRSTEPFEYYVYFPEAYKADVDWLLFVGVHAADETGEDCFRRWQPLADESRYVLLCPTFQVGVDGLNENDSEGRIATVLRLLYSTYPFQRQFFIAGNGAGGEFALRYALRYRSAMSGVASLAAEVYPAPTSAAEDFPILVLVGSEHEEGVAGAQAFEQGMRSSNLPLRVLTLDGEDDDLSSDASRLAVDFALQASRIIP